jgi:flagellar hook-basal body complex protein FliE
VTGKAGIHETMIALQKADISLRLLLQIRNKAMDAYREVMRMQF